MSTIRNTVKMQMFQESYGLNTKQNKKLGYPFGNLKTNKSLDEMRKEGKEYADKHIEELRASGYLIENGDTSWKKVIPISDEVKAEIDEIVRRIYVEDEGMNLEGKKGSNEVSYAYTQTLDPKDRLSAGHSVSEYYYEQVDKYREVIHKTNPNWPYDGSKYDSSIFDNFSPKSINITI